jgi:hypothetical protein
VRRLLAAPRRAAPRRAAPDRCDAARRAATRCDRCESDLHIVGSLIALLVKDQRSPLTQRMLQARARHLPPTVTRRCDVCRTVVGTERTDVRAQSLSKSCVLKNERRADHHGQRDFLWETLRSEPARIRQLEVIPRRRRR